MPEMDGEEMASAIRQKGYTGPILMISGDPPEALPPDITAVTSKPVNATDLLSLVEKLIGG